MKILPRVRNENTVVQSLDKELLVYDLVTNKAFCLNETSAIVFNACSGHTTFDELKRQHKFTDELIFLALDELKKSSLLTDDTYQSPFAGMTRRQAAKKVGLATMIALPLISSVIAPQAAAAQSGCSGFLGACSGPVYLQNNCCSGFCFNSKCFPCAAPGGLFPCAASVSQCDQWAVAACCSGTATSTADGPNCAGSFTCVCSVGGGGGGGGGVVGV
jgi:hypothetical protein